MTDFQPCKYFDDCSAPMCPRDTGAAKTIWFANEAVCRLHDVPEWVKRQRKIAKTSTNKTAGCFTLSMLERRCVIGKKISGIDPDRTDVNLEEAERNWLEKHPPVKPKSKEEKEKLTARMRAYRAMPESLLKEIPS